MMNCNKQYTIKVTEGNAFGLLLQLKSRTFQSSVPIDEDIDATHLEDIVIKVNNEEFTDFTADESGVLMNIPADMAVGTYNVELTGSYYDVEIRAGYFQCFSIVPWSYQSDAVNYIPGSPIATEAAYVVVGIIDDQELEDLKAELRLKIAAAEAAKEAADQAKEDFDEKAEALDNVAQQGTNPDANLSSTQTAAQGAALNSQIARGYIGTPQSGQPDTLFGAIANINIDTSTIAKQGTDPDVSLTSLDLDLGDLAAILAYIQGGGLPTITAIAKQGTNASATLTTTQAAVVDGNDTAIGVAKEIRSEVGTGSDTAAESGTLFAVLKWVKDKVKSIFNLIGSPASGQPSTLFAAIAAGGGGGGDAQESTSQAILAAVNSIIDAHIINNISVDGYVFEQGFTPSGIGDIWANATKVVGIDDDSVVVYNSSISTSFFPYIQSVTLRNLETIQGLGMFRECRALTQVSMPSLKTISGGVVFRYCEALTELNLSSVTSITGSDVFSACTSLRKINLDNAEIVTGGNMFTGNLKLIDVVIGSKMTSNFSLSTWSPTEALRNDVGTLVEPGETFANNLEKLLYNIREHIAANLPTRTSSTSLTITFSSAVKAAIQADAATLAAFTNKYWNIA